MNEKIVNADGSVTVVGDAGSVSGILAKKVKAATIPATYDQEGNETAAAIVPDASTLAVEVTEEELKTHAWRLPKVREEKMVQLRRVRNAKLEQIDKEIMEKVVGKPGATRTKANSAAEKVVLRDMPIAAEVALDAMDNTDDMDAFTPAELAD
jgi:hypothetical protein